MASDNRVENVKTLLESQSKYTYFLLASVGAGIGFAITQTKSSCLNPSQLLLAISILFWGISFYCGCRNRQFANAALYANYELLNSDEELKQNPSPDAIRERESSIRRFDSFSNNAGRLMNYQFYWFIGGSVFYIAWHVLQMYLRTIGIFNSVCADIC